MFQRAMFGKLVRRIREPRRFIQVLAGPRQVGKTTIARQVMQSIELPCHYASADEPSLRGNHWLHEQWETARMQCGGGGAPSPCLLILDEIQKLPGWQEVVKRLWDEDTAANRPLRVVLLGSSPLLVHRGLAESLAGRFELISVPHWSFGEMRQAFGWDLDQYLYFGGYPGAAQLADEPDRWARYVLDSLIETSISRDVLLMTRVNKPALLRQLFELGCRYSARVLSYNKMLGQLQDAGNTTTLAEYLNLLAGGGLMTGLQKYAGQAVRRRGSSPKLLVMNTALMNASGGVPFAEARRDHAHWGRIVETAAGAHLANGIMGTETELCYWENRNHEVDYVLRRGEKLVAFEVKSAGRKDTLPGLQQFCAEFPNTRPLLVGADGIPLDQFLCTPPDQYFS